MKIKKENISLTFYKTLLFQLSKVLVSKNFEEFKEYQVVIMAAGKGSRMGVEYPKPLHELSYPYGVNSLVGNILYLLERVEFHISSIKVVINRNDKPHFERLVGNKTSLIELSESQVKGTATCLNECLPSLNKSQDILLIWGDLALIPRTVLDNIVLLKENYKYLLSFPTKVRENPYVSFIRNDDGEVAQIFHSNDGEYFYGLAEQDCSCFILDQDAISHFTDFIEADGGESDDLDFVRFIPFLNKKGKFAQGFPIVSEENVTGVNTIEKAKKVQIYLDAFKPNDYKDIFL